MPDLATRWVGVPFSEILKTRGGRAVLEEEEYGLSIGQVEVEAPEGVGQCPWGSGENPELVIKLSESLAHRS